MVKLLFEGKCLILGNETMLEMTHAVCRVNQFTEVLDEGLVALFEEFNVCMLAENLKAVYGIAGSR